ncbi:MAG: Flp family type IVb pilin [Methylocystaceae bacterium]
MNQLVRLVKDEEGQGMVEYGLILALVAIGCITLLQAMGVNLVAKFTTIRDALL